MTEQLSVAGVDVFIEGEGDTIVMIHGWPDTYRLWDGQVAALKSSYRCVRFTLPGFEPSAPRRATPHLEMMAIFRAIVDAVSPGRPVTLMLHDWGCAFGYQFAMVNPKMVARIIGIDIGDAGSNAYRASLSLKAKAMIFGYQVWLAIAWRLGGTIGDPMTRFMARLLHVRSDTRFISSHMNYPYHMIWTGSNGSYRGFVPFKPIWPMLFVFGERKFFMFHSAAWLAWLNGRPGSRALGLPCGHWVMVSQRERFNQLVQEWMTEQQAGQPSAVQNATV